MPALTAVISANGDPMRKELRAIEAMARQTGAALNRGLNGHIIHGTSGVVRETMTVFRELGRGNFTRVPGSLSILAQYLGVTKLLFKDNATAAQVAAKFYGELADASLDVARKSAVKAAASAMAIEDGHLESEAMLEVAVADEVKARADLAAARAAQVKAASSAEAASAAGAEGAAGLTMLAKVGIATAVIVGGIALIAKFGKALTASLTRTPPVLLDHHPIAKALQSAGRQAELQREINVEVRKTAELYQSAAKAAERMTEITKIFYEHKKTMNDNQRDFDMAKARNDYQRFQAEKDHMIRQVDIDRQDRAQGIKNTENEIQNLDKEEASKKAQAAAIKVKSDPATDEIVEAAHKAAQQGQKLIDENEKTYGTPEVIRHGNGPAVPGLNVDYNWSRIGNDVQDLATFGETESVRKENLKKAHADIQREKEVMNEKHKHDVDMARKKELENEAKTAAERSAFLKGDMSHHKNINATMNDNEREDTISKLKTMQAELAYKPGTHGEVNSLQRVGAWSAPATSSLVDVSRRIEKEIIGLRKDMENRGKGVSIGQSFSVKF